MLQQILRDMFIDPELLAELDEEQKQILYCKMRQEQKRRWEEREYLLEKEETKKPQKTPKANKKGNNVKFIVGTDSNPWTWVMGDHDDDVSIEEMIERENIRKAKLLVEQELNIISQCDINKISITSNSPLKFPKIDDDEEDDDDDDDDDYLTLIGSSEIPQNGIPSLNEDKTMEDSNVLITTITKTNACNSINNESNDDTTQQYVNSSSTTSSPEPIIITSKPAAVSQSNISNVLPTNSASSRHASPISNSKLFSAKNQSSNDHESAQNVLADNTTNNNVSEITTTTTTTSTILPSVDSTSSAPSSTIVNIDARSAPTVIKSTDSSDNCFHAFNVKPTISSKPIHVKTPLKSESNPSSSQDFGKSDDLKQLQSVKPKSTNPTNPRASTFSNISSSPQKALNVAATISKFKKIENPTPISAKPSDKGHPKKSQSTRTGSTPEWCQKKLQNIPGLSIREEINKDGKGRGGESPCGSVVEKAKLDIAEFREKRMREIYSGIQSERQKSLERASKESRNVVQLWLAQEKKMKEADEERKLIARRVREDNARAMRKLRTESQIISMFTDDPCSPGYSITDGSEQRVQRPSSLADAIDWYKKVELKKGAGLDPYTGQNAPYYYGILTRKAAEKKLSNKDEGTFLVRLSNQIFGYAISLRGSDSFHNIKNIRHYLIEVTPKGYQFFGANQPTFLTLHNFVEHYKKKPLSLVSSDRLKVECGLLKNEDDDDDDEDDHESSSSSSSSDSVLC